MYPIFTSVGGRNSASTGGPPGRLFFTLTLIWVLSFSITWAQDSSQDQLRLLLRRNPAVQAAQAASEAARLQADAEGVLPDPQLQSSLFLQSIETRNGPMQGQLMLGQKFPLWGKLGLKRKLALLSYEIQHQKLRQVKSQVAYNYRRLVADYRQVDSTLRILQDYRRELASFRQIALTQYATGQAMTQHPILKLDIEENLVETRIQTLLAKKHDIQRALEALFQAPFDSSWVLLDEPQLTQPDTNGWKEILWRSNPRHLQAVLTVKQAEEREKLIKRLDYPDLMAGMTYTLIGSTAAAMAENPGRDALGVSIGINLPIWLKRNRARRAAAHHRRRSATDKLADVDEQVARDFRNAVKDLQATLVTYRLYEEELIPRARQMVASAFAAYQTGKLGFLDVLDSERMAVNVKTQFEKIKAERRKQTAAIWRLLGWTTVGGNHAHQ